MYVHVHVPFSSSVQESSLVLRRILWRCPKAVTPMLCRSSLDISTRMSIVMCSVLNIVTSGSSCRDKRNSSTLILCHAARPAYHRTCTLELHGTLTNSAACYSNKEYLTNSAACYSNREYCMPLQQTVLHATSSVTPTNSAACYSNKQCCIQQ